MAGDSPRQASVIPANSPQWAEVVGEDVFLVNSGRWPRDAGKNAPGLRDLIFRNLA